MSRGHPKLTFTGRAGGDMISSTFKKEITRALVNLGFEQQGTSLRRDQDGVSLLLSFDKAFGNQWCINVGFWLHEFGSLMTDRVEQTHIYLRLERLVPALRETILAAGDLDDPSQPHAFEMLLDRIGAEIDPMLRILGTEAGLREAVRSYRLSQGLVRKEVRQFLEK